MIYLKLFFLLNSKQESLISPRYEETLIKKEYFCSSYPLNIFPSKNLYEIEFDPITIFYGSNGSGKSTLLNIICNKLKIDRSSQYNKDLLFDSYVRECSYLMDDNNLYLKKMISSDDIFDYILKKRNENEKIQHKMDIMLNSVRRKKVYHLRSLKDTRNLKNFIKFRTWSRARLLSEFAGDVSHEYSNGETAIRYFDEYIRPDSLYLLDEPENSLSPRFQLDLVAMLEQAAYRLNSQLIIATHSPFILSLHGARIYDLDDAYSTVKKWYELENVKTYFNFFQERKNHFLNGKKPCPTRSEE